MAKAPKKKDTPAPVVNKDREDAKKVLREIMDASEDDQARVLAAIGLVQLTAPSIH